MVRLDRMLRGTSAMCGTALVFSMLFPPVVLGGGGLGAPLRDIQADTWAAVDAIGRPVAGPDEAGAPRENRTVGVFYYLWHGVHGYDVATNPGREPADWQGVVPPDPAKDTRSPHVIPDILAAPLGEREWGERNAFHHWGEPHFGFYLSDDRWVIRRHARMFEDAGVDVVIIEITNSFHYRDVYMVLLEEYAAIRAEGGWTPQVAFLANYRADLAGPAVEGVWRDLYSEGLYRDLWFEWKGKPLLVSNPDVLSDEMHDFFTSRFAWAWTWRPSVNEPTTWFGDGKDRWSWLDHTPQRPGWSKSPDIPEQVSVATAQHPHPNFGKSRHDGEPTYPHRTAKGLYFAEQWDSALETDPEFILVTQWNEWTAMRAINGERYSFPEYAGMPAGEGDSVFIDVYDMEFNRDIEPMRGGYGDNYYYQMVDGVRRFKGVRRAPCAGRPLGAEPDGGFPSWEVEAPTYFDTVGDADHRSHVGWGRIGTYINMTGRNDITAAKVARDETYYYFLVQAADRLTSPAGENWLELFVAADDLDARAPHWEGFHYRIHLEPRLKQHYVVQESLGGFQWTGVGTAGLQLQGNTLCVRVPREILRGTGTLEEPSLRFKWSDNRLTSHAADWLVHGDAAPNGRFQYIYRIQEGVPE